VLLLGVAGLFGLSYSQDKSVEMLDRLDRLQTAQVHAVTAQVAFKTQIQEWKNLLLRGGNEKELAAQLARFKEREAAVQAGLKSLRQELTRLRLDASVAERLSNDHEALGAAYQIALASYRPGTPSTAFTVDASIRGIDRKLNDDIDALARSVEKTGDEELTAFREAGAARYAMLRTVTLTLGALAVLASFGLVYKTVR